MAHRSAMIYQQVTLSGDAEWPKVADAVIEALLMTSANCTMRDKNCVRLPLLSGPLSILIWMRLVFAFSCSSIAFHLASSVSTMKSLVLYELPKVMCRAALSSSTIPHGIYFSSHPRSWSLAQLSPRVTPPREKSPIFTVALQSILQRLTPADARAWCCLSNNFSF